MNTMVISTPTFPTGFNMEQENEFNQRVDKDGCLDLIQNLDFDPTDLTFEVTYFTGWKMRLNADSFCTGIDLMFPTLTLRQMHEAYTRIEKFSLEHWQEWFVNRFPMKH